MNVVLVTPDPLYEYGISEPISQVVYLGMYHQSLDLLWQVKPQI